MNSVPCDNHAQIDKITSPRLKKNNEKTTDPPYLIYREGCASRVDRTRSKRKQVRGDPQP